MTVLIVEDSPELRRELVHRFVHAGWVAHGAADLCEARLLLDLAPDVVLTDRRLPDGDGLSLIVPGGPPVVMFTGDDRPCPGAAATVAKPPPSWAALVRIVGAAADLEFEGAVASW